MSNLATSQPQSGLSTSEPYYSGEPEALFGISFEDVFRAEEFLLALRGLAARGKLVLSDAVVVYKAEDGSVRARETKDMQPGGAAVRGAMWTGLFGLLIAGPIGWIAGLGIGAGAGAITAKVVDIGIPDEWVEWFKRRGATAHVDGCGTGERGRPHRAVSGSAALCRCRTGAHDAAARRVRRPRCGVEDPASQPPLAVGQSITGRSRRLSHNSRRPRSNAARASGTA